MQHNSGPQAKIHCEHRAIGVWELANGKKKQISAKEVIIWSILLMIETVIIIILLIIYSPTHNCKHFWILYITISSVVMSNSLQPHGLQHAKPPCPSSTAGVYSNSCPLTRWFHPIISSSVVPFASLLQSFPSGSFPMNQLLASVGQSIGVSASASVLPKNTQDSPLEWTGWISLQFKGLSRVFSNTTVHKHQFFGAQLSSQSNSHIHTWLLEKP